MAAIERRHLDLASIGAADSQSSAPAAAQSMYWSSSKSAMVRLLGSTRTWARTVNGTLIQASARRTVGLGASGPLGKLAKTLTFGLPFPVILSIAEAADQNGRQLSRSWSKPGCLRSCLYARRGAMQWVQHTRRMGISVGEVTSTGWRSTNCSSARSTPSCGRLKRGVTGHDPLLNARPLGFSFAVRDHALVKIGILLSV
jgi:hypothetical protein